MLRQLAVLVMLVVVTFVGWSYRASPDYVARAKAATFVLNIEAVFALSVDEKAWDKYGAALMNEIGAKRIQRRENWRVGSYVLISAPIGGGTAWWFAVDKEKREAYALTNAHVALMGAKGTLKALEAANKKFPAFKYIIDSGTWLCPNFTNASWPKSCLSEPDVELADVDLDFAVVTFDSLAKDTLKGITTLPLGDDSVMKDGDPVFMVGAPYLVGDVVARGQWLRRGDGWIDEPGWRASLPNDIVSAGGYSGSAVVSAKSGKVVALHHGSFAGFRSGRNIGLSVPISLIKVILALNGFPVGKVQL